MIEGDGQSQDLNTAQAVSPPPAEAMIPQSKVNDLLKGVKLEAHEKGRQAALAEMKAIQAQGQAVDSQPQVNNLDEQKINEILERREQDRMKAAQDAEAKRQADEVAQKFVAKIDEGKIKYPDLDKKVQSLGLHTSAPGTIIAAITSHLENGADVLNELSENPVKYAQVLMLAQTSGVQAYKALTELSDSIKLNEQAKEVHQDGPIAPLKKIQPSTVGPGAGNPKSAAEWARHPSTRS